MKRIWDNLSIRQRISIAVVMLAAVGGIYLLIHQQHEADFRPLFTGVAPEDAAAIVQKLKESGIEYRLPESGGTVLVPSARLAELRLNLAAAGLPKTGRIGFELFDKTNLGATEFTEHINYRRALEGELERSVMSLAEVEQARVHLTFPKDSVFLDSKEPAKASVMVKTRPGARLAPQNVLAINHLVASAVEGLSPDAVSVLDMNGNLLGRPRSSGGLDGPEPSEAGLDYRHKIEGDLLSKVNATLEPLLGANKFRASVSVECDFTGGEQSEEIFDPTRSVMVSSQRTEDGSGSVAASGVPGTASALPRPTSRPGASGKALSRMTENVTYQTSRTVKRTRLPAGGLKRMSLAVLVDNDLTWQQERTGYRRVLAPPTPEKLKVIRDLVAGITGFSAERGDQLVIESLPFESTLLMEPPALPGAPATTPQAPASRLPIQLDRRTISIGGGAAGSLLLLLVFLLFRRSRRPRAAAGGMPAALPAGGSTSESTDLQTTGVPGEDFETRLAERNALEQKMEAQVLSSLKLAPVITKTAEVLAKHLREKIAKEPEVSAQILRTWIHEEDA